MPKKLTSSQTEQRAAMSRRNDRIEPEITNPEYVLTPYEEVRVDPHERCPPPFTVQVYLSLNQNLPLR